MDELGSLRQQAAALRAKYERVGRPLMKQIIDAERRITDIKRERGELFYVDYMRYQSKCVEECEDLDDAKSYARALEDMGNGYVTGIRGPGVCLEDREWDE
jgi:hypothetical protein